MGGVGGDNAAV